MLEPSFKNNNIATKYTAKEISIVASISIAYLLLFGWLVGFKTDQLFLVIVFNFVYFVSQRTKKFALGYLVFIVYWILFDSMKAFPNYLFGPVHIEDLYNMEKQIFGIVENTKLLTPNEYFLVHNAPWVDVLAGLFYLSWIPVPLAFGFYLIIKNPRVYLHFSLTFLLVNILGFIIYYLYPAAPPWYVQKFGFLLEMKTPGSRAGLERFDDFFNINLFEAMYSKSSNVFAAMPSLHSAYPVIVVYYAIKSRSNKLATSVFAFLMFGIWFTAVYMTHHYILDVLLGIVCALSGILIFQKIILKNKPTRDLIEKYTKAIS